jgi:hypothetical protein
MSESYRPEQVFEDCQQAEREGGMLSPGLPGEPGLSSLPGEVASTPRMPSQLAHDPVLKPLADQPSAGADGEPVDEADQTSLPEQQSGEPSRLAGPSGFGTGPRLSARKRGRRLVRRDESRRAPFTPEQRLLILDSWQRSKLPAGDFAALVGLSKHTLYGWKKQFDQLGPAGLMDQPKGARTGSRLPDVTRRAIPGLAHLRTVVATRAPPATRHDARIVEHNPRRSVQLHARLRTWRASTGTACATRARRERA